jgi:hypothetical protein
VGLAGGVTADDAVGLKILQGAAGGRGRVPNLDTELAQVVRDAAPDWRRREVGDDFRIAQIAADLKALYEPRHGLGRNEVRPRSERVD